MQKYTCPGCSASFVASEMIQVGPAKLCHPCAQRVLDNPEAKVKQEDVKPIQDVTICALCGADHGDVPLPTIAALPVCSKCSDRIRNRPFPAWLRLSFLALLILAVASMAGGLSYFKAEAVLVRGERLANHRQWAAASDELGRVLEIAPDCRRALLLKIKADVMSDNFSAAFEGIEKAKYRKFESDLINEVNQLLTRLQSATQELEKAQKSVEEGKNDEALAHLDNSHRLFPESRLLHARSLQGRAGIHFDRKEYDLYLKYSEEAAALMSDDSMTQGGLASALAAKYALTGDESYKQKAMERLEASKKMIKTPKEKEEFDEYRERIEYRLNSKEIIDKKEYDRRFRPKK